LRPPPFKVVNKSVDFCEYYLFYAPASSSFIVGFYINHLDVIENFIKSFNSTAKTLIHQVSQDRLVCAPAALPPGIDPRVASQPRAPTSDKPLLTQRQLEIAQRVINGWTAREIALELDLSRRTVESHIDNLKMRLDCANRSDLIVRLCHLGMTSSG
jgi:LuxR family transcriptional regulator, quorum-sensing system regulator SolR